MQTVAETPIFTRQTAKLFSYAKNMQDDMTPQERHVVAALVVALKAARKGMT